MLSAGIAPGINLTIGKYVIYNFGILGYLNKCIFCGWSDVIQQETSQFVLTKTNVE